MVAHDHCRWEEADFRVAAYGYSGGGEQSPLNVLSTGWGVDGGDRGGGCRREEHTVLVGSGGGCRMEASGAEVDRKPPSDLPEGSAFSCKLQRVARWRCARWWRRGQALQCRAAETRSNTAVLTRALPCRCRCRAYVHTCPSLSARARKTVSTWAVTRR